MRSWLPALRIARREARRARGRSALVLAMLTLPVLALVYAAVSYDMFELKPGERYTRDHGASDAAFTWGSKAPVTQDARGEGFESEGPVRAEPPTAREMLAALPAGTRIIPVTMGNLSLRTRTGAGALSAVAMDVRDPLATGFVRLLDGAAPVKPGDLAVTRPAAARLGVKVGDAVQGAGAGSYTVTGVVEFASDLREKVLLAPGALPSTDDGLPVQTWLADTPHPVTWADVLRYNERGITVASRAVYLNPPPPSATPFAYDDLGGSVNAETMGTGLIIGGLGLLEVILLAGPAFAVGARRRQRDLALVAANGGTPAHLRRIVLADGVVLGLGGAVLGVLLGIAVAFATRPLAEQHLLHARAGGYRVWPLALLVIAGLAVLTGVLAALVPAFSAARFNLVAALTGRRGVVRSRKRWLALGLVLTAGGAAVVGLGAVRVQQTTILTGLVLGELGLVLCTPALVGLIARVGAALPLAPRIALRDTARNRSSAAPAISAVMAAVAGSVALGVYLVSSEAQQREEYIPGMPLGYVQISYRDVDPTGGEQLGPRLEQAARSALPVREVYPVASFGCPPGGPKDAYCTLTPDVAKGNECFLSDVPQPHTKQQQKQALADWRCDEESGRFRYSTSSPLSGAVDDGTLLAKLSGAPPGELAKARQVLAAGGVVVTERRLVADGRISMHVQNTGRPDQGQDVPVEKLPQVTAPAYVLTGGVKFPYMVISPKLVERVGFGTRTDTLAVATAAMPTQAQEDALRAAIAQVEPSIADGFSVERGADTRQEPIVYVLAAAAGLITLGAAGIATGLAAADGRADLSTLAAVGASPRVRRALSLSQSGVIAGLGSLLGVAAGLGAAFAVLGAFNRAAADRWPVTPRLPLTVPWQNLLVVLVVPLVAMLGAGLLTRSRLPIERRLT